MNTEKKIAEYLLQSNAIKLEPANPFTWASGWKSPIYCDNRKTLSYPEVRSFIRDQFVILINKTFGKPDVIAGVATGAIAHGVLVADALKIPFVYVRPAAKSHGLGNMIEGEVIPGKKVVVIEDLVSTGSSSLHAVEALRNAGFIVMGIAAVFTYGFPVAEKKFKSASCKLVSLSDYTSLLELLLEKKSITGNQLNILETWREDPQNWSYHE